LKKRAVKHKTVTTAAVQYKHDLGQHFLYNVQLLRSLVEKIGLSDADRVLEIGAGAGTLTRILCETAAHVTAVEVDANLIPPLLNLAAMYPNLTVIQQDIRKLDLRALTLGEGFWVVANIPYSITSQIFDLFWGSGLPVKRMAVMVQKEVADKLTATTGEHAYGLMSVKCSYYCFPEVVAHVPASAFTPPPKVDSAFVSLAFRDAPPTRVLDEPLLWKLIRAGYGVRRKTLLNALKTAAPIPAESVREVLAQMGLPQTVRGEELSIMQWIDLSNRLLLTGTYPSTASERC
jgi:16S rRNA (adenine1518-N6/adenine1519-N6)-dimethyltransferase